MSGGFSAVTLVSPRGVIFSEPIQPEAVRVGDLHNPRQEGTGVLLLVERRADQQPLRHAIVEYLVQFPQEEAEAHDGTP